MAYALVFGVPVELGLELVTAIGSYFTDAELIRGMTNKFLSEAILGSRSEQAKQISGLSRKRYAIYTRKSTDEVLK